MSQSRVLSFGPEGGLLGERAACDTTTSLTRGDVDTTTRRAAVVIFKGTIVTHASLAAIKHWRLGRILSVGKPVPVLVHTSSAAVIPSAIQSYLLTG